jgi:predicted RNA-binding Zn-ribbon protein involved in translation (DUF1610 family)
MERLDRCPNCGEKLSDDFILRAAAKRLAALWKNPATRATIWEYIPPNLGVAMAASITSRLREVRKGAVKVMKPCPWCGNEFGAREMRVHKPRCPKRPI